MKPAEKIVEMMNNTGLFDDEARKLFQDAFKGKLPFE